MRLLSVDARVAGRDRPALARVIESAQADVACVHAAPHLLRWRSISAALGRRSGMVVVGGGRPAGATLLLSTLAVDKVSTRDVRFTGDNPVHPAGAALALLRVDGRDVVVAGAALTGDAAQSLEQAHQLQDAIERFVPGDPPVLLSVEGAGPAGSVVRRLLGAGRAAVDIRVFADDRVAIAATERLNGSAALLSVDASL